MKSKSADITFLGLLCFHRIILAISDNENEFKNTVKCGITPEEAEYCDDFQVSSQFFKSGDLRELVTNIHPEIREVLEKLESHQNKQIGYMATKILELYFLQENDIEGEIKQVLNPVQELKF